MQKKYLNVGSGSTELKLQIPELAGWEEVTLDLNAGVNPDIVADMTNMSMVADEEYDALVCRNTLQYLYPHEIQLAFNEFSRVTKESAFVILSCPDLQAAATVISEGGVLDTVYESKQGPITPFDLVFGYRNFTASADPKYLHKCGFTQDLIRGTLLDCGFPTVASIPVPERFELWALGCKDIRSDEDVRELAARTLPVG